MSAFSCWRTTVATAPFNPSGLGHRGCLFCLPACPRVLVTLPASAGQPSPMPLDGEAMTKSHPMIYHIVIESDFRAQLEGPVYLPSGLHDNGFVHCALEPSVVPVANDYYAGAPGRLLLLEIDPRRLASGTRYEAAAPIAGGGSSHLASASRFPHVYGPIDKDAITGVGVLGRTVGGYEWPRGFMPLGSFLTADR